MSSGGGPLNSSDDTSPSAGLSFTRSPPFRQSSWGESSPWAPSGGANTTGINSLGLSHAVVPPFYVARFDALEPTYGAVNAQQLKQTLSQGSIKSSQVDEIMDLTATSSRVSPAAFFAALALLANAQLFKPLNLDSVAQAAREGNLGIPTLPPLSNTAPEPPRTSFDPPAYIRSESIDGGISAWGSPGKSNGRTAVPNDLSSSPVKHATNGAAAGGGGYMTNFAGPDDDEDDGAAAFGQGMRNGGGLGYGDEGWALGRQEKAEVKMREELAGVVFKHTVWYVARERTEVVERRYSDFVWLLDALTRRYPFRMLPALPPKRVHVGGNYVMTDDLFLERRRRGLERFLTFIINHPTLKHDGLVKTFFNERGDLPLWRKKSPISLEEEAFSRILTSSEEMTIPSDLEDKLSSLRARILPLVDQWTRITSTADRLAHRRLNQGNDYNKLGSAFSSALEIETSGWRVNEVEEVEREERALSATLSQVGEARIASAHRQLETTVEELKRHRELYVSFRDLFGRHMSLAPDNVEKLRRRVENSLKKLEAITNAASSSSSANAEFDKVSSSIESDQRTIDAQLRRRTFIRWCMWQEMLYLFRSTSLFKLAVRDFVRAEREVAERVGGHWEQLESALGM